VKDFIIGALFGIILGVCGHYLDQYIYKAIATVITFLIVKYISRKKVHDLLIIYVINFLCVVFVQIIVILLMNNIRIDESYWYLLAQILTSLGVLLLNWKVPLYKLLNLIEKEILLKLFVYILTSTFLITGGYFNFDYTHAKEYIGYFSILVFVSLLGLYRTIKYVFFYTNEMPVQLHDVKNILMGLCISIQGKTDINTVKAEIKNALKIIGIDTIPEEIDVDNQDKKILFFINQKTKNKEEIIVCTDIRCYEENSKVPLSTVLYMLGVLLDNAIETETKKEIIIKINISEDDVLISISNEYERKTNSDFEKMFQVGYSTKNSQTNGYGLPHLSEVVEKHGGEIDLKYDYNKDQRCNYLTLIININS
ncbi:MAG: GHKL domain-containing protein, partial [Coprobacillaceae bacterium]